MNICFSKYSFFILTSSSDSKNSNEQQDDSLRLLGTDGGEGMAPSDQTLMWQQSHYISPQEATFQGSPLRDLK
jgi:hypothetical protein